MSDRRSLLKATPVSVLKDQEQEHRKLLGISDRPGFLTISVGENRFRIFPKHPESKSWVYLKAVHWIPGEVRDKDGNVKEVKNLPVFNSRVHAGTSKDIVEEYVEFVKKLFKDELPPDKFAEKLAPLTDWKKGVGIQSSWVCYAKKMNPDGSGEIGRLELTPGTKEKMNALSAIESSNEPIVTDPFTDPDDGVCVIITYNPEAKDAKGNKDMKNFYSVSLEKKKVDRFTTQLIPTPLTDKDVEEFFKLEPLEKLYRNCYTRKDFQKAVTGLQIIDEREKYGIFQCTEFLEIVEEMSKLYPEGEDEEVEQVESNIGVSLPTTTVEEDEEEEDTPLQSKGDEFDKMDRTALKAYIKTKLGGRITVMKSYTDDQIRDLIRDMINSTDEEGEEESVETLPPTPQPEPEVKKIVTGVTPSKNSRLEELKNKHLGNGKK